MTRSTLIIGIVVNLLWSIFAGSTVVQALTAIIIMEMVFFFFVWLEDLREVH